MFSLFFINRPIFAMVISIVIVILGIISIPVLPELKAVLDATPTGNLAFLVTAFGKPFTSNGFGNWFRIQCDEAGLKHCSAHGLRKAGAALAAENGATERQLYLPAGTQWYDWHTDRKYQGGTTIKTDAPLEKLPLFALVAGTTVLLAWPF